MLMSRHKISVSNAHPARRRNAGHHGRHRQVDLDTSTGPFVPIASWIAEAVRVRPRSGIHGFLLSAVEAHTVFPSCLPFGTGDLPPLLKFLTDLK
jgi:hypothetical protein